jgi:ABC-type histidine transport system ATPase subunit
MGYLIYGAGAEYEIEDRALAHLKVAVGVKLRRQESFFLNWVNSVDKGSGRISLWISPNIPLVFRFSGSRVPELNPVWLDVMRDLADTTRGLVLVTESEAEAHAKERS